MTSPTTPTAETAYRRLYIGLWIGSGVALAACIVAGYPLVGVVAFLACAVASVGVFRRYNGPLFDERDRRVQELASKRTLGIVGVASAVVFPTTTVLWGLDVVEWPLWLTPIAFFVAAMAFVHVGNVMYESHRHA